MTLVKVTHATPYIDGYIMAFFVQYHPIGRHRGRSKQVSLGMRAGPSALTVARTLQ